MKKHILFFTLVFTILTMLLIVFLLYLDFQPISLSDYDYVENNDSEGLLYFLDLENDDGLSFF